MTDEEWERLKDSIRASVPDQPDKEASEARRKIDRDLDRLERILTGSVNADSPAGQRMLNEDKRWREFDRQSRRRSAEISEFAARSDEKLKALIDDTRNDRNKSRP